MTPIRLQDRFGRRITYLRLSVTDRCDLRCVYCMSERMTFLPRERLLTLEELLEVSGAFVELGVNKIRVTGGEPLVRRNVLWLLRELAKLPGLRELALTTNGTQLERYADELRAAGVRRINISLDSLQPERFRRLTRGRSEVVVEGEHELRRIGDGRPLHLILEHLHDEVGAQIVHQHQVDVGEDDIAPGHALLAALAGQDFLHHVHRTRSPSLLCRQVSP